jgi:glycosyltransferase involved in cell wall biosynthesis
MNIIIVLPTHNEEKIIEMNLQKLSAFLSVHLRSHSWKIIVVDNGSTDKTSDIVKVYSKSDARLLLLQTKEKGKGLAIKIAWQTFPADISVFMDADLATDLSALPKLIAAMENGADLATGSRLLKDSKTSRCWRREILSRLLQLCMRFILKTHLSDTPCGFKAVNRKLVEQLLPQIKNTTWFFDSELLLLAERRGYQITEIPVVWSDSQDNERKSNVNCGKVAFEYLTNILSLRKQLFPKHKEYLLLGALSILLTIFTNLPYLIGWLLTPENAVFSGIIFNDDLNTYFARIREIQNGHFLLIDPFTHEPQPRIWFDPFWLIVGLLGRFFSLSPAASFHAFRILLTPVFVIIVYHFLKRFTTNTRVRVFSLFLIFFASGVGGPLFPIVGNGPPVYGTYNTSIDLWVPEAFPYLSILVSPHFMAATTLLVVVFHAFFLALHDGYKRHLLWSIAAALFLFLFHPFKIPVVYGILLCYSAIFLYKSRQWKQTLRIFGVFLLSTLPAVGYIAWIMKVNSVLAWHSTQNLQITPPWYQLVSGFGLILTFAILGIWLLRKKNFEFRWQNVFLLTWLVFGFYLLYSPFIYQRRFIDGLFIPLAVFAAHGLSITAEKISQWKSITAMPILFIFLFIGLFSTNILTTSTNIEYVLSAKQQSSFLTYLPKPYLASMEWFKKNTEEEALVLSSPLPGNFVPAVSGNRVFIGHRPMTIFFDQKHEVVKRFFENNEDDEGKRAFLAETGVQYLLFGPLENTYGTYDPNKKKYLSEVYRNKNVAIYKIIPSNSTQQMGQVR